MAMEISKAIFCKDKMAMEISKAIFCKDKMAMEISKAIFFLQTQNGHGNFQGQCLQTSCLQRRGGGREGEGEG